MEPERFSPDFAGAARSHPPRRLRAKHSRRAEVIALCKVRFDFGSDCTLDDDLVLDFESFYLGRGRKELESCGRVLDLQMAF